LEIVQSPISNLFHLKELGMNQITIFGDIHGNLPALTAVLADIERRQLTNLYCLGDLVGYGTYPNEVITAIRERNIPTIMGNYDLGVGHDSDDCGCAYTEPVAEALGKRSIAWTNARTTADNKAYLRTLANKIMLSLGDLRVALVHGSPRKVNEYLFEDRPESSLVRLLNMVEAEVLVCGHTHLPYQRRLGDGRHVINAGSVGKPKDGDVRAGYVVLTAARHNLDVQFIRVPYDVETAAQAIEASDMPHEYAAMLRLGKG
jgi:predicted phosphodiesterase